MKLISHFVHPFPMPPTVFLFHSSIDHTFVQSYLTIYLLK